MVSTLDQIFVLLKDWIVSLLPAVLQPVTGVVLSVVAIICVFPALFAISVLLERKGLGRMQNRIGPNRVGPLGILQPVADGIKSLTKEDIVPTSADAVVHFMAPVFLVVVVFMGYAVLPMGRNMTLVKMDAALLFYFAMGASTELAVFMAGWSSRNKYSLLGAMRAVAQMISYEVPLLLSSVSVVMITGSLSLDKIVEAQNQYTWGFPHWYIFTPWGCAAFLMFAIAATAEIQPVAVRFAGGRVGTGGRLLYRIFRFQVCGVLSGRVRGHVVNLGTGDDAVSGRVVGAVAGAGLCALVDLVFLEGDAFDLRDDLDARNAAATAPGPVDEFCVEVCASVYAAHPCGRGGVAVHGRGVAALDRMFSDRDHCLCCDGPRSAAEGRSRPRSYRYAE